MGRRRLGLRPSSTQNWTKSPRYAIGPQYTLQSDGSKSKEFEAFTKFVEEHRVSARAGVKGARSLQSSAINILLQNFNDLDADVLQVLPKHIIWTLWHEMDMRCNLNLHSWKILSKALSNEETIPLGVLQYVECIENPKETLSLYTEPLACSSFDFITFLSIDCAFEPFELVKLTQIPNLGILEIIDRLGMEKNGLVDDSTPSPVDDRLLRGWASDVTSKGAFSVLRILRLWGHPGISQRSLEFVDRFPALGVFDVRFCPISSDTENLSRKLGWKVVTSFQALEPLAACITGNKLHEKRPTTLDTDPLTLWDGWRVSRLPYNSKTKPVQAQGPLNEGQRHMADSDPGWYELKRTLFQKYGMAEDQHWECDLLAAFTKLGELRNDAEIERAGVPNICQVTIDTEVGQKLISSVPLVSLRLGSRKPVESYRDRSSNCTVFVRIQHKGPSRPIHETGAVYTAETLSSRIAKRRDEPVGSLRRGKVRKLDTLLNSFM